MTGGVKNNATPSVCVFCVGWLFFHDSVFRISATGLRGAGFSRSRPVIAACVRIRSGAGAQERLLVPSNEDQSQHGFDG